MAARETKFFSQVGYSTGGDSDAAFLHVQKRTPVGEGLDYDSTVTHFTLFWNEDNNEVMLVKGSEVVYSEILSEED